MSHLGENEDIEEVLTVSEKEKLDKLRTEIVQEQGEPGIYNVFAGALSPFSFGALLGAVSAPPALDHSLARQLGFKRKIVVNNISGKKAWVILSPAPISGVSSIAINKVGQIDFSTSGGEYKCQQSPLSDNSSRKFDLDNNQIYYTVFFDCDGKWKVHFKDRKINAKRHDINLLERHIEEAVDFDFAPLK